MAELKVDLTKTESFKNSLMLISEIISDKRISEDIRAEYSHKYNSLLNPSKNTINERFKIATK